MDKPTVLSTVEAVYQPYEDSIRHHLSKVEAIDAIFLWPDDTGVVHVYAVTHEFGDAIYRQMEKKERLIENEHQGMTFEFHLRAHQGRKPSRTVPSGSQLVFLRTDE